MGGSMADATILLLDEFVLPPGSPGRCDAMLERDLLAHITTGPRRIVAWDTTADPAVTCADMEAEVARGMDLAIVGLGANGHIGTNEPPSSPDSRSRLVELAPSTAAGALSYGADEAPSHALTMGIGTLLDAEEIWLLVTGAHKRSVLDTALHGSISPELPASLLRRHDRFIVIADDEALPNATS